MKVCPEGCGWPLHEGATCGELSRALSPPTFAEAMSYLREAKSVIDKPNYYLHPSGIWCSDVSRWLPAGWGQAVQYAWRWQGKNGSEDLRKAAWWIRDCVKHSIMPSTVTSPELGGEEFLSYLRGLDLLAHLEGDTPLGFLCTFLCMVGTNIEHMCKIATILALRIEAFAIHEENFGEMGERPRPLWTFPEWCKLSKMSPPADLLHLRYDGIQAILAWHDYDSPEGWSCPPERVAEEDCTCRYASTWPHEWPPCCKLCDPEQAWQEKMDAQLAMVWRDRMSVERLTAHATNLGGMSPEDVRKDAPLDTWVQVFLNEVEWQTLALKKTRSSIAMHTMEVSSFRAAALSLVPIEIMLRDLPLLAAREEITRLQLVQRFHPAMQPKRGREMLAPLSR